MPLINQKKKVFAYVVENQLKLLLLGEELIKNF